MEWYYYKKAILPDVEIHHNIEISKKEVNFLLKKNQAWLMRFTNNFDKGRECLAYYVIKDNWGG